MTRTRWAFGRQALSVGVVAAMLLVSCGSDDTEDPPPTAGLANPASEYCVSQGGEVEIVEGDGGEAGVCVLPDGTRIDEWEYYRDNVTSVP